MNQAGEVNKYKNTIINVAVIIAALLIAYNIYKGNLSTLGSLKGKISDEEKKSGELEKISRMENKIAAYRKLLVKRETSAVMNDISAIAKATDVKVLSLKPGQRESRPDYLKDNFDVSVNASSYDSLAKFINTIESYNNVYTIDNMEISNQSELQKSGLTVNLRIGSVAAANQ